MSTLKYVCKRLCGAGLSTLSASGHAAAFVPERYNARPARKCSLICLELTLLSVASCQLTRCYRDVKGTAVSGTVSQKL